MIDHDEAELIVVSTGCSDIVAVVEDKIDDGSPKYGDQTIVAFVTLFNTNSGFLVVVSGFSEFFDVANLCFSVLVGAVFVSELVSLTDVFETGALVSVVFVPVSVCGLSVTSELPGVEAILRVFTSISDV